MARAIPFDFVLELLAERNPITKPMFGCHGVYIDDKIVFILRDRKNPPEDDGVWICTSAEYHASLRAEFPALRDLAIFGPGPTNWQNLPLESDAFEESVARACELVLHNDPRIGRIPKSKLRGQSSSKKSSSKKVAKAAQKKPSRKKSTASNPDGTKRSSAKKTGAKKTGAKKTGAKKNAAKKFSRKNASKNSSKRINKSK